uniref:uncharacterized mitochondrial protein AtMg00810-like n=1 Tax=Erigeron canadensis TaxID=72917 RepID=UPI001CB98531|nr:uncharacterized mitochondrial protein AtMg00810-like [Erigeron canadensis]
MAYLLIYVEDIILTTSHDTFRARLISLLVVEFAMKDLGPLSHFLRIHVVTRTHDTMFLSHQSYALDIIERVGMSSCKSVATPVDTKSKLSASASKPFDDPTLYRSLASALQYLTFTGPDISYVIQQVCMPSSMDQTLRANTDADWAGCPDTRHSSSGYCVYLGTNLLSWSSKHQTIVSRSSAEAEYQGVARKCCC